MKARFLNTKVDLDYLHHNHLIISLFGSLGAYARVSRHEIGSAIVCTKEVPIEEHGNFIEIYPRNKFDLGEQPIYIVRF